MFFFTAVYWTGYELLKSKFTDPGFVASFSSGMMSGTVSTRTVVYNSLLLVY